MTAPKLDVDTPERVSVELPIAGIGFRALAYLIDVALLFVTAVVLYFGFTLLVPDPVNTWLELGSTLKIALALAGFVVLWTYWTALEVTWHGQTVGKRAMKIRVVRADGSPVTIVESAIRNLLRLVDFLPSCYPVGVVTMLIDRQHRRLGDIVAGTVLVREEQFDLSRYEAVASGGKTALSTADIEVITSFLSRAASLDTAARLTLGKQLAARMGMTDAQLATATDEQLLAFLSAKLGGA